MLAKRIMIENIVTARPEETVEEVLQRMRSAKLRMIPVVDADNCIQGLISTISMVANLLPEYLSSGDLKSISYAPDLGILRQHYLERINCPVSSVMKRDPLIVAPNDSLLSVSSAMTDLECHGYALVADKDKKLLGVLSSGDILDRMMVLHSKDDFDA